MPVPAPAPALVPVLPAAAGPTLLVVEAQPGSIDVTAPEERTGNTAAGAAPPLPTAAQAAAASWRRGTGRGLGVKTLEPRWERRKRKRANETNG